jgi:hypothetical protein
MEKSNQIAWKIIPLGHFFPIKVVPLIEVLLWFIALLSFLWLCRRCIVCWYLSLTLRNERKMLITAEAPN